MAHNSANVDNNSRLDVSAYGFWGGMFERAFFDVRVFNPCARSNRQATLLRASIMSVRGARSSANRPANGALHVPVELQSAEGQLLTV